MTLYRVGRIWYYDLRYDRYRYAGSTRQISRSKAKMVEARKREAARTSVLRPDVRDILFSAFAREYLALHIAQKRAKAYFEQRVRILTRVFGDLHLSEITVKKIARYQAERAVQVSPATANRDLAVLKGMFTKAIEWGHAVHNPVKRVRFLRETGRRERFLTPDEAQRLLDACSAWLRPIVVVALHTGMRRGELMGLRWHDVDFTLSCLHLDPERTKSGRGRKIPMNRTVQAVLREIRAQNTFDDDTRVFRGPRGGDPTMTLRREFKRAVTQEGFHGFRFHDLRHSHASFLVQAGVPLNTVRDILGHQSIAMTLRYAHLSPSARHEAVSLLDGVAGVGLDGGKEDP